MLALHMAIPGSLVQSLTLQIVPSPPHMLTEHHQLLQRKEGNKEGQGGKAKREERGMKGGREE